MATSTKRRRVAVIGAGGGGLASIKTCLEEGLDVVAFESRPNVGGVWSGLEDKWNSTGPRMYKSLMSNTSKSLSCFSDFPFPASHPPFLPHPLVQEYLETYAKNFNLLQYIRFNVRVIRVMKSEDHDTSGRWKLTLSEGKQKQNNNYETRGEEGSTEIGEAFCWEEEFDGVIVAAGFYSKAKTPEYPGLKTTFNGGVSHACSYYDSTPYKGKTVLVVGNQHSAFDIACELANNAKLVYLSVGDGATLESRVDDTGLPYDLSLLRAKYLYNTPVTKRLFASLASRRFDHTLLGLHRSRSANYPNIVNDSVHILINCGKVKTIGHLREFSSSSVTTREGQTIEGIDHVIFATGYDRDLSFLDPTLNLNGEKVDLYKQVFPVYEKQPTLALVGFIRIGGSVLPALELQARFAVYTLSGRHKLPPTRVMEADSERYNRMAKGADGKYRYSYPAIMVLDELAAEIGVIPHFWKLVCQGKPKLAYKTLFGPAVPPLYRLMGPGSWSGAEDAILGAVKENRSAVNSNYVEPKEFGLTLFFKSFLILCAAVIFILMY